jgi:recombinational DNA repair protein RecR
VLKKNRIQNDELEELGDALRNSEIEEVDLSLNPNLKKEEIEAFIKNVPSLKIVQIQGIPDLPDIEAFDCQIQPILKN